MREATLNKMILESFNELEGNDKKVYVDLFEVEMEKYE